MLNFDFQGDLGAPLQFFDEEKNNYKLVGLTTHIKKCDVVGLPIIYTNIEIYLPWIGRIVWNFR